MEKTLITTNISKDLNFCVVITIFSDLVELDNESLFHFIVTFSFATIYLAE